MNDHAGRHKLSDFVLRYRHTTHILKMGETRFRKDDCKWAEKKGYRNRERMAVLIFATAQNGIPVLPNAPSTQIVITEAIRVLRTVEASRDAILTQMQALAKTLPEYSLVREMPCHRGHAGSAPDRGDRRCPTLPQQAGAHRIRRHRCAAVPVRQIPRE